MKRLLVTLLTALMALGAHAGLDHRYVAWEALLERHVRWLPDQAQTRVDYAGLARERAALQQVLAQWSAVRAAEFDAFTREQQMAFLINAYNGFTLELILTRWPDLKSIKDLGSFFTSPWKQRFFTLLDARRHLDWIEHEQLRPRYQEPRIHAAVNCASIGCPALRPEAFVAERLDAQLEDGMRRFVGDRSRNRVRDGRLEVNEIFKWFREDFERGHRGWRRVEDVFATYARQVSDDPAVLLRLRERTLPLQFLDYDWSLNGVAR